jgi:tRNA A37 methylthiotransferase MiaB
MDESQAYKSARRLSVRQRTKAVCAFLDKSNCLSAVIRSTYTAGVPGATDAEFRHLLEFMQDQQADQSK